MSRLRLQRKSGGAGGLEEYDVVDAETTKAFDTEQLLTPGGTAGQVLTKFSGADYDRGWVDPSGLQASFSASVETETAFGEQASAGTAGTVSRGDHTHGSPTDPVPGHEAAQDPHTQYALNTDLTTHEGASDPHTGYQRESEKGVASGYASLDTGGTIPDAQIPAAIARDTEVSQAVTDHEGAADPHTVYATNADLANHEGASDPHTTYQKESEKGAANGYAGLGAAALVPVAQLGSGTPDGTKFLRDDGTWQVSGGGAHALGGAQHTADTLANLNSKISDADVPSVTDLTTHTNLTTTAHGGVLPSTAFVGLAKITVGTGQPGSPSTGDLWVDTN